MESPTSQGAKDQALGHPGPSEPQLPLLFVVHSQPRVCLTPITHPGETLAERVKSKRANVRYCNVSAAYIYIKSRIGIMDILEVQL